MCEKVSKVSVAAKGRERERERERESSKPVCVRKYMTVAVMRKSDSFFFLPGRKEGRKNSTSDQFYKKKLS